MKTRLFEKLTEHAFDIIHDVAIPIRVQHAGYLAHQSRVAGLAKKSTEHAGQPVGVDTLFGWHGILKSRHNKK